MNRVACQFGTLLRDASISAVGFLCVGEQISDKKGGDPTPVKSTKIGVQKEKLPFVGSRLMYLGTSCTRITRTLLLHGKHET